MRESVASLVKLCRDGRVHTVLPGHNQVQIKRINSLNKSTIKHTRSNGIEEGRAASKSPHEKFGYFLSLSQQGVSADIIQKLKTSPQKQKEQRQPRFDS